MVGSPASANGLSIRVLLKLRMSKSQWRDLDFPLERWISTPNTPWAEFVEGRPWPFDMAGELSFLSLAAATPSDRCLFTEWPEMFEPLVSFVHTELQIRASKDA